MESNGAGAQGENWQLTAPQDAVVDSIGLSYVCVEDCCWSSWQPGLPAEIAAFLAEPVVVGAAPRTEVKPITTISQSGRHTAPSSRCC